MEFRPQSQWQVFDGQGQRKYLNAQERQRFLAAADRARPDIRALCHVMAFAGCRISEALALRPDQFDPVCATLTFRTLKRRRPCFRMVPIPAALAEMIRELPTREDDRYWPMHRATAWRHVKRLLVEAGVDGPRACCRGLRHGFGIHAASKSILPNLIQKWMGHALPTTTAIYLDAVGVEEREFAERMW